MPAMDTWLKSSILFSLIVVAQADRALSAHKPNGGGLHAVAVLRSQPISTAAAGTTTNLGIISETAFSAIGNYLITNGNGTWTYSYYANNGNLNNNDAGQGDFTYPTSNIAFFNANGAIGTQLTGLTGNPNAAGSIVLGLTAPSYDVGTSGLTLTQYESPVARFSVGITSLVFTGAKTGIAVGVFGGAADYDPRSFSATSLISQQVYTTLTGGELNIGQQKLNILLTYDGAASWVRATAVPELTTVDAPNDAAVAGTNFAAYFTLQLTGTAGSGTVPPYPTLTVGDLTSVFFASKSVGWAVGGNDVLLALTTSSDAGMGPAAIANSLPAVMAGGVASGLVLMTQNGGSVWKNVPIWVPYATLLPLWVSNDPSLKTIFATPIPGILFGVQSDASGKHVYAVGSGSSLYSTSATALAYITAGGTTALGVQVKPFGTILYSGNSGMSWVQQTAPTLYSGLKPYALFSVAVQKGTTAIAVGGSPFYKFGAGSAGTIIYTMNGGFSWVQSVYPGSTGTSVPVLTSVALQPSMSGVQQVWVGGYTTNNDGDSGTVVTVGPALSAGGGAGAVKKVDFYPVAAVTGLTVISPGTTVSSGVPRAKGQIYTILMSKDAGKTFMAAPTAGFPTGFVQTAFGGAAVTDRAVYGITWDNANHGWVYGYGFIMSTQNGGVSWVYETPADVGVTTVTPKVAVIASVPTTY